MIRILPLFIAIMLSVSLQAQHSEARQWNETLLDAIRMDFARPTIHARNLFHSSVAMYDAWAAYEEDHETYFLGKTIGAYSCPFEGISIPMDKKTAQNTTLSYAVYRILRHRFENSPQDSATLAMFDAKFLEMGYDATFSDTDYSSGAPAALGNYLGAQLIAFGRQDGANEEDGYGNEYYFPWNFSMNPAIPGSGFLFDPNRWQPLSFDVFRDQAGNEIPGGAIEFLSPEWGNVVPFALTDEQKVTYSRDGFDFNVFYDPGAPPKMNIEEDQEDEETKLFKWNFNLVSIWSSHLDPSDSVFWDISPASIGNIPTLPTSFEDYDQFYKEIEGGDPSLGHAINPSTGQPYPPQIVPRADYARVLAEFWADGPESETPPGHWFTILNYVNDHPEFEKRFKGQGDILEDLEWDVKAYFLLGGAVHDAAVVSWSIKGWYDYVRPISIIRYMCEQGQSTDPSKPSYDPEGIPLVDGFVELIETGDEMAGTNNVNVGKIKLYAWRGHGFLEDPETETAGVGWILGEEWWPYQRPTFVTPPFAGYISGHSTFSRTAAEVMTLLTGDAFFPGGVGEFIAQKDEFLRHEKGPSQDIILQWATYRDASDQTSLSRIWGGIHPPVDDIPGRIIGIELGEKAFAFGEQYFGNLDTSVPYIDGKQAGNLYPNPIKAGHLLQLALNKATSNAQIEIFNNQGQRLYIKKLENLTNLSSFSIPTDYLTSGFYTLKITGDWTSTYKLSIY